MDCAKKNMFKPTHARTGLPVNQNPNPTPPNRVTPGLHDTAATYIIELTQMKTQYSKNITRKNCYTNNQDPRNPTEHDIKWQVKVQKSLSMLPRIM